MIKKTSIVLVPYKNNINFKKVVNQILNKTKYPTDSIELIVIDNNTDVTLSTEIRGYLNSIKNLPIKYKQNHNIHQLAGATNEAVKLANSHWFVYLCANDIYIYDENWLNYLINNLTTEDYAKGYRLAGTIAKWPNYLKDSSLHFHAQGSIFIAFTEYMKKNKYSLQHPFSFMDVIYSAKCLEQGFKIKHLDKILGSMDFVTKSFHDTNKKTNKYYITHLHGNSKL